MRTYAPKSEERSVETPLSLDIIPVFNNSMQYGLQLEGSVVFTTLKQVARGRDSQHLFT